MAWQGFLLAFAAAFSHSCIDSLRKIASKRFDTTQCVCLVALLEGSLSFAFVAGQGTMSQPDEGAPLLENTMFMFSAFMSAALRLLSLLLYQTAIQLAPLSVTVPYLSFTPAMLLCTAYLMIGEQPSWCGLVGVMIVTAGGYLLAFSSSSPTSKRDDNAPDEKKTSLSTSGEENLGSLEMGSKLLLVEKRDKDTQREKGTGGVLPTKEHEFPGDVSECWDSGAIGSLQQLGDSKGSVLMMLVAFLWSLTSTFDKMGMAASPTLATYLAVQRAMTAAPCVLYLFLKDVSAFRLIMEEFPLIMGLVASELMTVLLYLWSLKLLFVSYAVAAKRTGILLSVLSGWLFFGERIKDKIMYVLLMMLGMMLIVLAPDIGYNKHLSHP